MAPKRIYLSSTFADLKAHRAAVGLALERAGLQVARMEAYVAADERPLELCLKDVARCDLYVGLVGWRAGYVPPAEHGNPQGLTITELEYRQAKTSAIPALVFMTRPEAREAWPEPFDDARSGASDGGAGILALRERLGREQTVSHFAEPDELATLVLAALMRHGVGQRPWQLPPLAEGTVGRPALETALQRLLERPGPPLLVHGGGGFGKTRLVVRSCASPEAVARFEGGLVWVTLGERPALAELLRNLVIELSGQPPAVAGVEALARAARDLMAQAARGRRWLLVVDDAWRAEDLHPWLAVAATDVVVTSRIREILAAAGVAAARELPIEDMVPIEARALLMRGLEDEADNRAGQPPVPGARGAEAAAYERACNDFADRLGGWPLLIALANARLQEERRRDARSATARPPLARLAAVCTVFERKGVLGFDRARGGRDDAIARSLELSLDFVEEEHSGVAGRAAELAIFPADQPVPTATLAQLWAMDPFDVGEQVLRPLDNASLLAWDRATDTVRVHDLVAAALCTRLRDAAAVHARLLQAWGEPHALPDAWAWRWYGWHAVRAGDAVRLQRLLSDAVWLRAKLRHAGLDSLLAEFNLAPMPGAVQRIGAALLLSADVLAASPEQLVPHLLGRLLPLDGGAIDPGLVPLAASAAPAMAGEAWLRPRSGGLVAAGGALLRSFDVGGEWPERLWVDEAGRKAVVVTSRLPGAGHQVALWDLATGTRLRVLPEAATGPGVGELAVGPDARWAVLATARSGSLFRQPMFAGPKVSEPAPEQVLRRVDLHTGEPGPWMALGPGTLHALALAPDGSWLAWTMKDGSVRAWAPQATGCVIELAGAGEPMGGLVWSADSRFLLVVSSQGRLLRWRRDPAVADGAPAPTPEVLPGTAPSGARAIALAPDNLHLAVAAGDGPLLLMRLDASTEPLQLYGHRDPVCALAFTPDGSHLLSAAGALVYSPDNTVRAWEVATGRCVQVLRGHGHRVTAVVPLSDGRRCVSACLDGRLRLWQLLSGDDRLPARHEDDVEALATSADGRWVVSGGGDGRVKVWDAADGRLVHTLPAHARRIQWITPLPDARRVAVLASDTRRAADGDSELALIDIERGEREGAVMAPGLWFGDAQALSPDGHYVVLADRNRGPLLWSLPQRAAVGWLDESAKSVMGLVFARDGSALYIGAEEGCLRRWQMPAGPMTMLGAGTPLGPDGPRLSPRIGIRCLALNEYAPSPLLLAGDDRGRVTAWDPASGRLLATVQADSRLVNDLLCLPGGRAVSTGGDCTLVVHAPDLSRVLVRSSLGDSIAYGLAATPDGRYLGAAAVDGWFTVWSTDSGTRLAGFHVEGGAQCCVALRDGSGFAVGDRAGGVHVLTLEGVA